MYTINKQTLATVLISTLVLAGCSDSDDEIVPPPPPPPDTRIDFKFDLEVTNLTHAQPLSPIAFVAHADERLWSMGESSDTALETMAESGDNSAILARTDFLASIGGTGVLLPGLSETIILESKQESIPALSVATMLVNTNDAFTGKTGIDVSSMQIGDSISMMTVAFDAGTEANSETAGTVPGPAAGGEGFNQDRDDVDYVAYHPGVVGSDGGLTSSSLSSVHKFDNPVMKLTITRLQ